MFDVFQLDWVEFRGFGMDFVCCFLCLGFSENRQFAPRTLVRAANPWQKLWKFWICSVRAATPCWRREMLGRKLGVFGFAQFAPRPPVGAANPILQNFS